MRRAIERIEIDAVSRRLKLSFLLQRGVNGATANVRRGTVEAAPAAQLQTVAAAVSTAEVIWTRFKPHAEAWSYALPPHPRRRG